MVYCEISYLRCNCSSNLLVHRPEKKSSHGRNDLLIFIALVILFLTITSIYSFQFLVKAKFNNIIVKKNVTFSLFSLLWNEIAASKQFLNDTECTKPEIELSPIQMIFCINRFLFFIYSNFVCTNSFS